MKSLISTLAIITLILTGCGSIVKNSTTIKDMNNIYYLSLIREYRISPGDRLSISFYGDQTPTGPQSEGLSNVLTVRPDGKIRLQLLDSETKVAGFTINEITAVLEAEYRKYLKNAVFSVNLVETAETFVSVGGQVRTPGAVRYTGPSMNVLEAIVAAGGFTEYAKKKEVVLIRKTTQTDKCVNISLNLEEVISGVDSSQNLSLISGDVILVQ